MNKGRITIILICIGLLVVLLVFAFSYISALGEFTSTSDRAEEEQVSTKDVYYIASDLTDLTEHDFAMRLRQLVIQNTNFGFQLVDCAGDEAVQLQAVREYSSLAALYIITPVRSAADVSNALQDTNTLAILLSEPDDSTNSFIYFSNDECAQLISNSFLPSLPDESRVAVIGDNTDGGIFTALRTSPVSNRHVSYRAIMVSDIFDAETGGLVIPDLSTYDAVILLQSRHQSDIINALSITAYDGRVCAVSSSADMPYRISDGSLSALIYRDIDDLVQNTYDTAIQLLQESDTSPFRVECPQLLLTRQNIGNTDMLTEENKPS